MQEVSRHLYAALKAEDKTHLEFPREFYEEFSRPLAALEAQGMISGAHTIGGRFFGGLTITDPSFGVAFSGFLAITARGRPFGKLSLPRFAALGAGGGLLLFGVLAINAWQAWSVSTALANATIFVLLGGGSATATLMLARRAGPALKSGDESRSLGAG